MAPSARIIYRTAALVVKSVSKVSEPMSFSLAYGIEGANTLKIIVSWFVDDKNLIVLAKTQKLGRGAS